MDEDTPEPRMVRIYNSADPKQALEQYYEVRRSGLCETAVIVCDMRDGALHVLGQGLTLDQITQSLATAFKAALAAREGQDQHAIAVE